MEISFDKPSGVGEEPMGPSELLDKGPTPASEYDWSRWTGFPGHAALQLPGNLRAAAGAFLAHQKHKTSRQSSQFPRTWPAPFMNVMTDLGVGTDIESSQKLQAYVAEKRASLFDAVSIYLSICFSFLIIPRHM
jgi:hypothetical protein